jgi:hypothetical protein
VASPCRQAPQVLQLPCPGLADAIEAAGADPRTLQQQLDTIAQTMHRQQCRHRGAGLHPLPAGGRCAAASGWAPGVTLVDTADAVARRVVSLLDLPTPAGLRGTPPSATPPPLQLLATAHPAALQQAALRWLGHGGAVQLLQLPGDAGTSRA